MEDFLRTFSSAIPSAQQAKLQEYIAGVDKNASPLSEAEIKSRLDQIGSQISKIADDPTKPDQFNTAVSDIIVDIAAIYAELDNLATASKGAFQLLSSEVDRLSAAVADLEGELRSAQEQLRTPYSFTNTVVESFGSRTLFDHSPRFYESVPKAWIDSTDNTLRLEPTSSFSRTVTRSGANLCTVEIDKILGQSLQTRYPAKNVIDGNLTTIWQEVFHSGRPIRGQRATSPWLPDTYRSGAAVRLHFEFEKPTPISNVVVRLAAEAPVQILQVAWDNPSLAATNLLVNGTFEAGATGWVVSVTSGVGATGIVCATGNNSSSGFQLLTSGSDIYSGSPEFQAYPVSVYAPTNASSGTTYVTGTFANCFYTLELDVLYTNLGMNPDFGMQWLDVSGNSVVFSTIENGYRKRINHSPGLWKRYSLTASPPSGAVFVRAYVRTGSTTSGSLLIDNVELTRSAQFINSDQESLTTLQAQLPNCDCENLWLTLAQPHYSQRTYRALKSTIESYYGWGQEEADSVTWVTDSISLSQPPGSSIIADESARIGGAVLQAAAEAYTSDSEVTVSALEYQIGVREVDLIHRENQERGRYVSKPFNVAGEVREIRIIPDVRQQPVTPVYRLLLHADDDPTDAVMFSGSRIRIACAQDSEASIYSGDYEVIVPAERRSEQYSGTDWSGRLYLKGYPYINATRIHTLVNQMASGASGTYNATPFDPNAEYPVFVSAGEVTSTSGYRPLKVTLVFADGSMARPDNVGEISAGDIQYAENEILPLIKDYVEAFTSDTDITSSNSSASALAGQLTQRQKNQSRSETRRSEIYTVTTSHRNVVGAHNGALISLYWSASGQADPGSGDTLIPPQHLEVDASRGMVKILEPPPSESSIVRAYYYYQTTTGLPPSGSLPTSGIASNQFIPASYPLTRNVTDYVEGKKAFPRRYNNNPLSPEYYPIYDYVQTEDGALLFAENLSAHGDTPATINVEYETMGINPRLLIDLYRTGDPGQTPIIGGYTLLVNARRYPMTGGV